MKLPGCLLLATVLNLFLWWSFTIMDSKLLENCLFKPSKDWWGATFASLRLMMSFLFSILAYYTLKQQFICNVCLPCRFLNHLKKNQDFLQPANSMNSIEMGDKLPNLEHMRKSCLLWCITKWISVTESQRRGSSVNLFLWDTAAFY